MINHARYGATPVNPTTNITGKAETKKIAIAFGYVVSILIFIASKDKIITQSKIEYFMIAAVLAGIDCPMKNKT